MINKNGVAVVIPLVVCADKPRILVMQMMNNTPIFFINVFLFFIINVNIVIYYSMTSFSYFSVDILLIVDVTLSL
jgi:hypothetical protein